MAGAEVTGYPTDCLRQGLSPGLRETERLINACQGADALWLGNPNNPTGGLFAKEWLLEIAEKLPRKWIIVDEAFMPFVENRERFSLLSPWGRPNILVLLSLTKFYSLAGLRLGGVMAHPRVIARLRHCKEPWTVNGVAERIAPLLLECKDFEERSVCLMNQERTRVFHALESLRGVHPYPPHANFILCKWGLTKDLDDLLRYFLMHGIYIRDCRNFRGLEGNCFRIGLRLPEENDCLLGQFSTYPGIFPETPETLPASKSRA
jgi:threonine-phosphate decarboxylase